MAESIKKRIKREPTPLIDGNIATFVWRGEYAPDLVADFTGWEEGTPIKLAQVNPGLWTYQLSLPMDAYIEYSYKQGTESVSDPFNPRQSPNGVGGYNHYFLMPGYESNAPTQKKGKVPHGKVTRFVLPTESLAYGSQRRIFLYQPPVKHPVPLVVVWDGQDYLNRVQLNLIVDHLIAEQRIQPIALALVNNGGAAARVVEYACNDATLFFLLNKVLPLAQEQLNLVDTSTSPGAYGVVGASMGGLMALYTAVRLPQIFGKVLSQSGAFNWGSMDMVVFDLLEHGGRQPLKIWMDVGSFDIPSLLACNRRMYTVLEGAGYRLAYGEYPAGHNYPAWRDEIWRGLEWLYRKADPPLD